MAPFTASAHTHQSMQSIPKTGRSYGRSINKLRGKTLQLVGGQLLLLSMAGFIYLLRVQMDLHMQSGHLRWMEFSRTVLNSSCLDAGMIFSSRCSTSATSG